MRVKILKMEVKDIVTKAGAAMRLRVIHGFTDQGDVFKMLIPKGAPDMAAGDYDAKAEPFVTYESELAGRVAFERIAPAQK